MDRLVSQRGFDQQQEVEVSALVRKAEKTLRHLLPNQEAFKKHESHFKHDIIEVAVQLHQAIETSRDDFQQFFPEGLYPPVAFTQKYHGRCRLIDIDTWQEVKPDPAQMVVRVLLPGFQRLPAKSEPVVVMQPVLVVSQRPLKRPPLLPTQEEAAQEKPERARDRTNTKRENSDSEAADAKRDEEPSNKRDGLLGRILGSPQASLSNSRLSR